MIFLTICIAVAYVFLSSAGLLGLLLVCFLVYLIDYIFKRMHKKLDEQTDTKIEEKPKQKVPIKKYKIVDLKDNQKVICSYEYEADAIMKVRELRKQHRQVIIKIK